MENKRSTIYDVAKALGVSVSTVNRAIHNQQRISPETKKRILDKAEEMGFKASQTAQSLRRKPINIAIIMYCPVMEYLYEIKRGMEAEFRQLNEFNVFAEYFIIDKQDLEQCKEEAINILKKIAISETKKFDGVILFPSGENADFLPVIAELKKIGIPVATVANDVRDSQRAFSVCGDGVCAGKLAAELLYRGKSKNIAILIGGLEVEIHKENVRGFYQYSENHHFVTVNIYQHQDNPKQVQSIVKKMLDSTEQLDGIYITSALAPVICKEIEACEKNKKINIITTDLFDETRKMLDEEKIYATIFQDPYRQGKDVVKKMYKKICGQDINGRFNILPHAIFSSNCYHYLTDSESDE